MTAYDFLHLLHSYLVLERRCCISLWCSAYFWALSSFIQGEVGIGIFGLVIGFLFSPYGLPIVGVTVIAFIELINDKIKAVWIN